MPTIPHLVEATLSGGIITAMVSVFHLLPSCCFAKILIVHFSLTVDSHLCKWKENSLRFLSSHALHVPMHPQLPNHPRATLSPFCRNTLGRNGPIMVLG